MGSEKSMAGETADAPPTSSPARPRPTGGSPASPPPARIVKALADGGGREIRLADRRRRAAGAGDAATISSGCAAPARSRIAAGPAGGASRRRPCRTRPGRSSGHRPSPATASSRAGSTGRSRSASPGCCCTFPAPGRSMSRSSTPCSRSSWSPVLLLGGETGLDPRRHPVPRRLGARRRRRRDGARHLPHVGGGRGAGQRDRHGDQPAVPRRRSPSISRLRDGDAIGWIGGWAVDLSAPSARC